MVGLQPGDTASSAATPRDRHRLLRSIADVNAAAHFLTAAAAASKLTKVELSAKMAKTAIVESSPRAQPDNQGADYYKGVSSSRR
jgi:hypothetical protein